ncbi:MAG: hypothetical protein J6L91_02990 [Clostridia bacterium]|nr:hypothetical protein [Clostridia bacterium]
MKPWDKVTVRPPDDRMFIVSNPYGYVVNISNPQIQPLIQQFKRNNLIAVNDPFDVEQRADFERYIISLFPSEFAKWHNENQKNFTLDGKTQKWLKILGVC